MQTNDVREIEMLEIKLFDHLTVCKQLTDTEMNCSRYIAMSRTI